MPVSGMKEMFDLNEMAIFVKVVEAKSFTGAANLLDLPKSTVSRKITQLEERLGVRLIQRTTRTLRLTDTGNTYYDRCSEIMGQIEDANITVTQMQEKPTGTLRITAPVLFGEYILSDLVTNFMEEHPQLDIELVLSDTCIDLIQDGIDLAFRVGDLADSTLIARRLGQVQAILCATPEYLEKFGEPMHPSDLKDHRCIAMPSFTSWSFFGPEGEIEINIRPNLVINDFNAIQKSVLNGSGISAIPTILCVDKIQEGKLVPILCPWRCKKADIHAVYPSNRHLATKVRAFVDYTFDRLSQNAPWDLNLTEDLMDCEKFKQQFTRPQLEAVRQVESVRQA